MSDNYLRFIPTVPEYVPSAKQIDQALTVLSERVIESVPRIAVERAVRFVDPGSNLESIACPRCGAKLDFGWWGQAISLASQNGFQNLQVEVPCCGRSMSLNDLEYTWPAGFARFLIEYRNPPADVGDAVLRALREALGVPLRKIWAHY
jgi:hypothetical protein